MSHTRKIALLMIALAASAWHFANPPKAKAFDTTCLYAGQAYSVGACRGGQVCNNDGTWSNDDNCPKTGITPELGPDNT